MKKLLLSIFTSLALAIPVLAQIHADDQPVTRTFTGEYSYTVRIPSDQVIELVEWHVTMDTVASNTCNVRIQRGGNTNDITDFVVSADSTTFETASWTDYTGFSLMNDDVITWSNTANTTLSQLTYKFRHPGD